MTKPWIWQLWGGHPTYIVTNKVRSEIFGFEYEGKDFVVVAIYKRDCRGVIEKVML